MDRPLLSLRSALIFLLALLTGGVASGLSAVAGEGTARSLLAGLTAAGLAVPFFNHLIAADEAGTDEGESHG